LTEFDNDLPRDFSWSYVGTFDNSATTTQLRYLAKVIRAVNPRQGEVYRTAFLRGVNYIFTAQNPNGGWPQVWPLEGDYHDAITYNDGAMINVLRLVKDVSKGSDEFAFVPQRTRKLATSSLLRGIDCILATQILAGGRRTVWCQQHDLLTLQPTSARNYEMPSQGGAESAEIMLFLMELPNPNAKIIAAVHAAATWLEQAEIHDVVFKAAGEDGRKLVPTAGAEPLWARYYQIGADRPIFGDRDKTIHSDVGEISKERRNGYSWFSVRPMRALDRYAIWKQAHPSRPEKISGKLDDSLRQTAAQ
jgi:PelA/Pel-15E family pectate lyase